MTTGTIKQSTAPKTPKSSRTSTKKSQLASMLSRPKGATLAQLQKALAWQPHTVRAAISGLRKAGMDVVLDSSGKTPVYKATLAAE